jgi:hypothetical protein
MMQSAQEAPQEVDASPKRFQDYLQEFLVTDSTWKAPKREKVDMAMHVVKQALPEALIADTTNQHVSPFVREFMLKDHTSLAALQTPDPQTPAIHNPSTQGVATPLERQGQQWFDPQAMQAQAPQALEPFRNPPHHRQTSNRVSLNQPVREMYNPRLEAEQQHAQLLSDVLIGYHKMLARYRERSRATQEVTDHTQALVDEAGLRQQELLKQIDVMLNPENAEESVLVAITDTAKKQYDVQPTSNKLRGVYDTRYYDVVQQTGKESRVKIMTIDNSSDAQTYLRAFGHSVIVVDNIAYNMSPDGFHKIPYGDYLKSFTNQKGGKPSQGAVVQDVQVTNQEAERIKAYLQKPQGKYDPLNNNCSTVCIRSFVKGVDESKYHAKIMTPNDLYNFIKYSQREIGKTEIHPKRNH